MAKIDLKVTGLQHKTGVSSKSNNEYDFYVLHGIYESPDTEGAATFQATVGNELVPFLKVGNVYPVIYHFFKGKPQIDYVVT